jgi:uncharacterized protein (DUF486 family)
MKQSATSASISTPVARFPAGPLMKTAGLLIVSNIFMTFAWYGHLKFRSVPLVIAIFASWGIALFEYMFQVPANRIGSARFTVTQLKIMQECITLFVFTIIAYLLFGQKLTVNSLISYALIIAAVYFAFLGKRREPDVKPASSIHTSEMREDTTSV